MNVVPLDHFYTFGDVYEALDACDQLDLLLGRLGRQALLSPEELIRSRRDVEDIRGRLEAQLPKPI